MSIRTADGFDLPRIVELGSRSLEDGPYAGVIKDVPATARKFAEQVLATGKILVGEDDGRIVGLIGFIFARHHFSDQPYAAELMWYVEPEHRKSGLGLQLLWAAEKAAKEMGAEDMLFTAPNTEVASIYKRFGYSALEVVFRKNLTCLSSQPH
jgi:GNAT superfamily N-acetyltransferase